MSTARVQICEVPFEPAPDYPELRAAYAAETAAMERLAGMKARRVELTGRVETLKVVQARLAGRMARGEEVTGSDVRKAREALQDAEAELATVTAALPRAAHALYEAGSDRNAAEKPVYAAACQPFHHALRSAEAALEAAKLAHEKARANVSTMPALALGALDAVLDAHGRDRSAPAMIAELRRREQVNTSRRDYNPGGMPLLEWP